MRRSILFPLTLTACLALAACAKKEDPAASTAGTTPAAGTAPGAAADSAIDFSLSGGSRTAPSPAGTTQRAPSRVNNLETPEIYFQPPPFYPLSQRMQGIEGRVDIGVLLDENGGIVKAEVLHATAPQFADYALDAIKSWKFGQARQDGKPVGTAITLKIPFYSEYASAGMPPRSPLANLVYFEGKYYGMNDAGKLTPATQGVTPLLEFSPQSPTNPEAGKTYRAKVEFTVTTEGQVINAKLNSSNDPAFAENVMSAIRFWQFVPGLKNGTAQETRAEKEFTYTKEATAP